MKRMRKKNNRMLILLAILGLTIGYAIVSGSINFNGLAGINKNTWDIHFENIKINENSIEAVTAANISDSTTVEFEAVLNKPGEFYEFTVDAKNDGNIDGIIETITLDVYDAEGEEKLSDEDIPSYVLRTITYSNGNPIVPNQVLKAGNKERYKVRIEYSEDISEDDVNKDFACTFKFNAKYKQDKLGDGSEPDALGGGTFIANTDPNKKGLVGIAYLDPTDYTNICEANSTTTRMPKYPATSSIEYDGFANEYSYPWNYYDSATSWAVNDNCMKWYVYKDTGDTYKLLLDHNTTVMTTPISHSYIYDYDLNVCEDGAGTYCSSKYSSDEDIKNCVVSPERVLKRDTKGWQGTPTMITADEIREIIESSDPSRYSEDDYYVYLENGFEWLADNISLHDLAQCNEPSCYVKGYWTKATDFTIGFSDSSTALMGYIYGDGASYNFYKADYHGAQPEWIGVRPVIEVDKNMFN